MKKIITLIAILAIAVTGIATADIADGGFTNTVGFVAYDSILDSSQVDDGWYVGYNGDPGAWHYDTANHEVTRGSTGGSRSFGQIFTTTRTGNQTIVIDWTMVDEDGSSDNRVSYAVYGVTKGTGSGFASFNLDSWSFNTAADSGSTATKLADWRRHNVALADMEDPITIDIDCGTGYDEYAIGFSTFNMNAGDSVTVRSIQFIPEPATFGLLGLGIIAFIRRK